MSRLFLDVSYPEFGVVGNLKSQKISALIEQAIREKKSFHPMDFLKYETDHKSKQRIKRITIRDRDITKILSMFTVEARNILVRESLIEFLQKQNIVCLQTDKKPVKKTDNNMNAEILKQLEGDFA